MNAFNDNLALQHAPVTMTDYFRQFVQTFYPTQDMSFMEYFLSLCDEENDGKFVVPHAKLVEYGVVTSNRSSVILEKLNGLGMIGGEDYVLQDVLQNSENGRPAKTYFLTPESFKLCLMRAQRRANQPIDPVIYARYYLTLEKVHVYFMRYEKRFGEIRAERLLLVKDERITEQFAMINDVRSKLDAMIARNDALIDHAERAEERAEDLSLDLDFTRRSLSSKLDTVVGMLGAKSIVSTKNPRNPEKVHHFLVMGYGYVDELGRPARRLSFIAGQESRIRTAKRQKLDDQEHPWTVEIEKHYNANPIDLRNNIEDVVNEFIKTRVNEFNATSVTQITREHIPITCKKLSATYVENDYVSYDELKAVINRVNFSTQRSPYEE